MSLAILYICLPVSTFVSQLWTAVVASALQSFVSQLWTSQVLVAECSDIEKPKLFGVYGGVIFLQFLTVPFMNKMDRVGGLDSDLPSWGGSSTLIQRCGYSSLGQARVQSNLRREPGISRQSCKAGLEQQHKYKDAELRRQGESPNKQRGPRFVE